MSEPLPSPVPSPQDVQKLFVEGVSGAESETPTNVAEVNALLEKKALEKPFMFFLTKRGGDDAPPVTLVSDNLEALFAQAQKLMIEARRGYAFFMLYGVKCPVCFPQQMFAIVRPDGKKEILVTPDNWVAEENGCFSILVDMPRDLE